MVISSPQPPFAAQHDDRPALVNGAAAGASYAGCAGSAPPAVPSLALGTSPFGAMWRSLPAVVRQPPVEAVVFAWGVCEDGQTGLAERGNVPYPKASVEAKVRLQVSGQAPAAVVVVGRQVSWQEGSTLHNNYQCVSSVALHSHRTVPVGPARCSWIVHLPGWQELALLGHGCVGMIPCL
jgi:hypothetical protein